jgi:hypothetical protein
VVWKIESQKEAAMTNGVLARNIEHSSSVVLTPERTGTKRFSSSGIARIVRREKASRRKGGRFGEVLPPGLLDRNITSPTLASLAQAAASSGKRLILEIRDENPVQIVRTTTKGA